MPNWCSNTLTVSGSRTDLAKAKAAFAAPYDLKGNHVTGDLLLWNLNRPYEDGQKDAYLNEAEASYHFNLQRWGTKWEIDAEFREDASTDESLVYVFDSAWSPPEAAIAAAAAAWPTLEFYLEFDESGNDFSGFRTYSAGELIESHDAESRSFYCDACQESAMLDWDEDRVCPNLAEPDEGTDAYLAHALNGDHGPVEATVLAAAVSTFVSDDRPWSAPVNAELVGYNTQLSDPKQVAEVFKAFPAPPTPAQAHVLLAGLSPESVQTLLDSADAEVAHLAHLGTVGYELQH